MELYIWLFITLSANILIFNFSCCLKQLPPFPCRFNFCNTPLLQNVKAPGLKFIGKKQFSMFFSLPRLYLTLATIKTSECSTLGRCILKRVRFRYKNVCDKSFEKTPLSNLLSDWLCLFYLFTFFKLDNLDAFDILHNVDIYLINIVVIYLQYIIKWGRLFLGNISNCGTRFLNIYNPKTYRSVILESLYIHVFAIRIR